MNRNSPIDRVNILGVDVSAVNLRQAVEVLDGWIECSQPNFVCVTGVHGIMESQRDVTLREIHNQAGLVTPDGMPLVWISHWKGKKSVERVYGPDLMLEVCRQSVAKGHKHYLYGGGEGVPELLANKLINKFPGLNVVGTYSPPYRNLTQEEDQHITSMINQTSPDFIWVGLSTPKQERWMAQHFGKLRSSVMIGVGAAFDFHAGLKLQAPKWVQRNGLEWLFRLITEPRRLWRRYLRNNSLFIFKLIRHELGMERTK